MTVQELIEELEKTPNKNADVVVYDEGERELLHEVVGTYTMADEWFVIVEG